MRAPELLERFVADRAALADHQSDADRVIAAALAGHLVHHAHEDRQSGPWRLDPVPLILDGAAFDHLADGVRQRMRAMEALLADLYGPRASVRQGWVPGEALSSSSRYRHSVVGAPPPSQWLTSYAVDVIQLVDGSWRVVRDLTDTPTGVGYALLDRSVMARVAAQVLGAAGTRELTSISAFPAELRHALAAVTSEPSPRIVLFSGGVDDPAYVEHSALARLLGFHLVEAPDLVVRRGRLWLRALSGLEPVDVVYRRRADAELDPIELDAAGGGVPGLALAAAEGGVALANAHGAGVLEDAELAALWPSAVAELTGEQLSLAQLTGWDRAAEQPTFRDGGIGAAPVVIRLHAVAGADGSPPIVLPGGNGRVLAPGDDARRPTARLAKDVWVLGRATPVVVTRPLPQVDLASSVPTRAADGLYWLGRAAERAEGIARTARVVASRREQDPSLVSSDGGRWAARMAGVVCVARNGPLDLDVIAADPIAALDGELDDAARALGDRLHELVAEAANVGEYLSTTTGRVLRDLAQAGRRFEEGRGPIDALDAALTDLASLAGLWNESVVRGPAWRFGDLGRRIERSLVVLGLVDACVTPTFDPDDVVDTSALEILLAANESLVAYRRRYRSDVELGAAASLLLHDEDNPRSYAACVRRLAEHAEVIGWDEGVASVRDSLEVPLDGDLGAALDAARGRVLAFGAQVVERWFATPVDPVVVHGAPRAP